MPGDKTRFYDSSLEIAETSVYRCERCDFEKEVAEEFDLFSGFWFPIKTVDAICPLCEELMDRRRDV